MLADVELYVDPYNYTHIHITFPFRSSFASPFLSPPFLPLLASLIVFLPPHFLSPWGSQSHSQSQSHPKAPYFSPVMAERQTQTQTNHFTQQ